MATILHLSDLHRSRVDPVTNAELIAALESDRLRWPSDLTGAPDIVVISGDVVQGVPLGAPDPDAQLSSQYSDAAEFLDKIVTRFLAGDRSRLVLIPGNHDIDWNIARASMVEADDTTVHQAPKPFEQEIVDPSSDLRWSWKERRAYKIADQTLYRQRYARFLEFRRHFYLGISPSPLSINDDLLFVDYPDLDLSITGLSSWFGNDCYCHVGAIDPEILAAAQGAISESLCGVHIAVWHHSVAGAPGQSDFMDARGVHRLIDYGFRVGLYGHQHETAAAVMTLKLPTQEEMALVSAGSLAAGRRELPTGSHRQYSLIEVSPRERRLRVHVREAVSDLIFAPSARTELGGATHVDLSWTAPPQPPQVRTRLVTALDDAYRAVAESRLDDAATIVSALPSGEPHARQLRREVFTRRGDQDSLLSLLSWPLSLDELVDLVKLCCDMGKLESARSAVSEHGERLQLPQDIRTQLEGRIAMSEATG